MPWAWCLIAGMLGRQSPKVEAMLRDAADDLLAFTAFPVRLRGILVSVTAAPDAAASARA
jgi:hypothetical protein